jgi:hypothetical protein
VRSYSQTSRDIPADPPRSYWKAPPLSQRLAAGWDGYQQLTRLGFPRQFQIVQFPNLPFIIGFVAGTTGRVVHGADHAYLASVGYLAMGIWAYEELVHGSNWFRHLLGLGFAVVMVIRVAHAVAG